MGRKYSKAPVEEALCEFQFIPRQPWDITIPGLIYERIKGKFPERRQQLSLGVQLQQTEQGFQQKIEPAPPRIQFFSEDKTAIVQVAPDLLVVNKLKPYENWEKFRSMIRENYEVYKGVTDIKGLKRIGLRYINVIEFNELKVELPEYFKYYPFIPQDLPQTPSSFLTRVEFPYDNDNEILILTFASIVPRKPNVTALVLDIDYATKKPEYVSPNNIDEWLDKAHNRVENAFESSITDKTRNLFGIGLE